MRIEERRRQLDSGGDGRWRSRVRGGGRQTADGWGARRLRESRGLKGIGGLRAWATACALRLRYGRYTRHRTPAPLASGGLRWRATVEGRGGHSRRSRSRVTPVTGPPPAKCGAPKGQGAGIASAGFLIFLAVLDPLRPSETSGQATGWCVVRVIGGRNTRTV